MSKKTDQIKNALAKLAELQQQLKSCNEEIGSSQLDQIQFEMGQQVNALQFLIQSLYTFTGKSTSYAKRKASAENGKKGGRPPKAVTTLKRRRQEIEQNLLPALEQEKRLCDNSAREAQLSQEIAALQQELQQISLQLQNLLSGSPKQ